MRRLVRKTIITLASVVFALTVLIVAGLMWWSWTMGNVNGYSLGLAKAEIVNPFKQYVEGNTPFVYDAGIVYPARRVVGKRAPYYIIHPKE